MLTPEQLDERRNFLGSSEVAAAIGESPWQTPLQLYKEKRGEPVDYEDADVDQTLPLIVGQMCEPIVVAALERKRKVTVGSRQMTFHDFDAPWRRVTVDGIASDSALVEAKTAGYMGPQWGKQDDTDLIPMYYIIQVQRSLGIIRKVQARFSLPLCPYAWVPAIISNNRVRIYKVLPDRALIDEILPQEHNFWERVQTGNPPDPVTREDLRIAFPHDKGTAIRSTPESKLALRQYQECKEDEKKLVERMGILYVDIGTAFGEHSTIVDSDTGKPLATWKEQDGRLMIEEDDLDADHPGLLDRYRKRGKSFRVLRFSKKK